MTNVVLVGDTTPSRGTYVLRIDVDRDIEVAFGQFNGGTPIAVASGRYVYIGSALGRGSTSLPRRLLRHATRSARAPAHQIRDELIARLGQRLPGAPPDAPSSKTLHWHIDYLLDRPEAALTAIFARCGEHALETHFAASIARLDRCAPLAPSLGASDARGTTHLMRAPSNPAWWPDLQGALARTSASAPHDLRPTE